MYCQSIILSALLILFQDNFAQSGIVIVPRDGCTWRGGDYGEYTRCDYNEIALGSCGSGKDPDCHNGEDYYDMLYCCILPNYAYSSCEKHYASYGESLSCIQGSNTDVLQTSILEGICGSGKDDDCEGENGDSYNHMIECCDGFFSLGEPELYSAGSCYWQYSDYGDTNICIGIDEAMFGRCGSGGDPDCDTQSGDNAYVGIQCCRLVSL